jgi:hypothetical protein
MQLLGYRSKEGLINGTGSFALNYPYGIIGDKFPRDNKV